MASSSFLSASAGVRLPSLWREFMYRSIVPSTITLVASDHNCGMTPSDFRMVGIFVLATPIIRLLLNTAVLRPIARRAVLTPSQRARKRIAKADTDRVTRFQESAWKLLVYTTFQIMGWRAMITEAKSAGLLLTDDQSLLLGLSDMISGGGGSSPRRTFSQFWLRGWPEQRCDSATKNLYAAELGFYVASIGMLLVWEVRRKDFAVMLTHHVITSLLIFHSWTLHFMRVGLAILLLHDASDILMESAKLCNYAEQKHSANMLFGLFMLSWIVLRLLTFPFVVVRSTLFDALAMFRAPPWELHIVEPGPVLAFHHGVYNVALLALCCMHVYWFTLICQMAHRAIVVPAMENRTPDGVQDIREEDEDEEDDAGDEEKED
ncbi:hypothetical protein PPROV_000811300 [Pycnococcus provasolii]|uniref:TLC domain-containing protein n=1 Tax=Pycnococcus provasolii TaxID=41880 RepID=A0A830HR23_9CHLO|nr:hypothetical protein PPROV_000811300 [Pycnococcus provasolii]